MECFICGINGEQTALFSAIVQEGVVPVCEECSIKEKILVIKRVGQLRESERNQTIYERLSRMAGLDPVGHKEKIKREERIELKRQELRRPVENKNQLSFPNLKQVQPQIQGDLIRNYHWTILNARRAMKMTQKQLADAIAESETAIRLVERGILPNNYMPFIKKLQTVLGVVLFDKQLKIDFNLDKSKLKELSVVEKKENESKVPYWKRLGFLDRNKEKRKNEESEQEEKENKKKQALYEMNELTKEEMDKITFEEED